MVNASNNTTPQNAVNATTGAVVQLKTIDELRTTVPTSGGEIASVLEYTKGSKMGGGVFVYDATDTTSPDDGGIVFIAAGDKRWKRVIQDYSTVTVLDFGAIADGKTDCIEAVKRMYTWSQRVLPAACCRYPVYRRGI